MTANILKALCIWIGAVGVILSGGGLILYKTKMLQKDSMKNEFRLMVFGGYMIFVSVIAYTILISVL